MTCPDATPVTPRAKPPDSASDRSVPIVVGLLDERVDRWVTDDARQRLAAIVESSSDAILSTDLAGTITSWNKAAERIYGYTAAETLGQPITMLMPADRQDEETRILARIREGERIDHFETGRRHKSGRLIDVSLSISPMRDAQGRLIGASKIARDVTERKRHEAQQSALFELTAHVNRAAALDEIQDAALEAISRCHPGARSAILLHDEAGVMRFRAWRRLSDGYRRAVEGHSPWSPDDHAPQPIWINDVSDGSLGPALREVVECEGIHALAFVPLKLEHRLLGKLVIYHDTPHVFTAEELRPAQTIASQVAFAVERQHHAAALELLVNERTASLREAIAQMEEFSYSVSHDLRAPLRALHGYAAALAEDYGSVLDAQGREYLHRISRSSARMDRLIQDILIYSRLSRRDMPRQHVAILPVVRDVIDHYPELDLPRAEITIVEPLHAVMGHEPSLTQIMANLLTNAVKFVPRGAMPRVRVSAVLRGREVELSVEDNGIGIKPEHQPRLFGLFERIHPVTEFEGTGIGLAIVRRAAERMGGRAGVESDGDSGSRFWVRLPAADLT